MADGDGERAARLEALGADLLERIHEQAFGTAPVDDVLARIEEDLPGIAREAGVDVIVSKWAIVHRGPLARLVDVTGPLAAAFDLDERTLAVLRDVLASDPIAAGRPDGRGD